MQKISFHNYQLPALLIFNALLFLPLLGHGFVSDDFFHLNCAATQPLQETLTKVCSDVFYNPVSRLSYKLDWFLWGRRPFPFAVVNLLIHLFNIVLVYFLALRLWHSKAAAWWSATGFSLLFPANIWAIMWISTRVHLLATLFYAAAMLATFWFTRTEKNKILPAVVIILCASLAVFSKEIGATAPAAVLVIIFYEKLKGNARKGILMPTLFLCGGLGAAFLAYAFLRAQSGAVFVSASGGNWYSYTLSLKLLGENLGEYAWRTYGLLALLALGVVASFLLGGRRINFNALTKYNVLLSITLFSIALAPVIFLAGRSGIYTYLPGVGAALLLGAAVAGLYEKETGAMRFRRIYYFPAIAAVIILIAFTVGQSKKWVLMAETNNAVIAQIIAQQPELKPNAMVVIRYAEIDRENKFPDGLTSWTLTNALRLIYRDSTLQGRILQQNEFLKIEDNAAQIIEFNYAGDAGGPKLLKAN